MQHLYEYLAKTVEMSEEEARKNELEPEPDFQEKFDALLEEQRNRSRTASQGEFKGGLADASVMTTKLHTAAHLLDATLIRVLGKDVHQKGANITAERLRFDFTHHQKVTPEVISQVEQIVNEAIDKDYPVSWQEEDTETALKSGAIGVFGHKYGEKVKVYIIGDAKSPFSREICGGPHVEHTGQLAEGGKKFKIIKEEASSAGVRRIKATLV